jgi:hypothetical protein
LSRPDGTHRLLEILMRGHVWLVATLVPLLVRVFPLRLLVRLLERPRWLRPYGKVPTARIVERVAHRLRRPRCMKRRKCLREGLVLYHFLHLAGRPAILHFGVYAPSSDPRRLHGHCWVTLDGECLSAPPGQPAAVLMTCGCEDKPVS